MIVRGGPIFAHSLEQIKFDINKMLRIFSWICTSKYLFTSVADSAPIIISSSYNPTNADGPFVPFHYQPLFFHRVRLQKAVDEYNNGASGDRNAEDNSHSSESDNSNDDDWQDQRQRRWLQNAEAWSIEFEWNWMDEIFSDDAMNF